MTSQRLIANSRPATVHRLSAPEQLLVWAFRRRAFGGSHWQWVSVELRSHLPEPRAECLLQALDRLIVTACLRARRTLTFHRLDCHCLGADELSLLTIVAAAQCSAIDLARATSRWLMQANAVELLVEDAQSVADIFEAQGWRLPLRQLRGPELHGDEVERSLKRVLH